MILCAEKESIHDKKYFCHFLLSLSFLPSQAVYEVGLEVSASISYLITPKASASLCSTYDASACFEVFSTTAVKISVRSYSRNRYVSCSWTGCRVSYK